jgi:hypothetical protein
MTVDAIRHSLLKGKSQKNASQQPTSTKGKRTQEVKWTVNASKHITLCQLNQTLGQHRNTTLHRRLIISTLPQNHHEALLIGTLLRRGCWRRSIS